MRNRKAIKAFIPLLSLFLIFLFATCKIPQNGGNPTEKRPKNIILMIGDGMGISQITAGMYKNKNRTVFEQFSVIGLIKTHSAGDLITDSAAGATAFACGKKTKNGFVGMDRFGNPLVSLMEKAQDKSVATGLVVTSTIVHATPACYYAHNTDRMNYEAIASDFSNSDINLAIGYGLEYFNERTDGNNLMRKMQDRSFSIMEEVNLAELKTTTKTNVAMIMSGEPRTAKNGRGYLPEATTSGLEFLDRQGSSFFMMVEGSQIDWGGHARQADYVITEMIDFDKTVQAALDFAKNDGETLLIVTSDHECGGFTITEGLEGVHKFKTNFSTAGHTPDLVPVFAYGPGANRFAGLYENTQIYHKMKKVMGW